MVPLRSSKKRVTFKQETIDLEAVKAAKEEKKKEELEEKKKDELVNMELKKEEYKRDILQNSKNTSINNSSSKSIKNTGGAIPTKSNFSKSPLIGSKIISEQFKNNLKRNTTKVDKEKLNILASPNKNRKRSIKGVEDLKPYKKDSFKSNK